MADEPMPVTGNQPHAELAADASNLTGTTVSEERAAKRLKTNDVEVSQDMPVTAAVPGEGLHDAPAQGDKPGGETVAAPANKKVDDRDNNGGRGVALIKKEYLIDTSQQSAGRSNATVDDDAAEGRDSAAQNGQRQDDRDRDSGGKKGNKKDKKKKGGQNTERSFGQFDDAIRLCNSRALYPEFSPRECRFGDRCRLSHDLRKYLDEGRRGDVETFGGQCPVFEAHGKCPSGWKCRFVKSHMKEVEHEDGRKELVLVDNSAKAQKVAENGGGDADTDAKADADGKPKEEQENDDQRPGVYNVVPMDAKIQLSRKRIDFTQADQYITWLDGCVKLNRDFNDRRKDPGTAAAALQEHRAQFVDPPFKPSEKRRLYFGPETPTLAPLTTQGNLPFRRLCVDLGCELTYSEMAMGLPLLQGQKADWTLMKAHESELAPPKFNPGAGAGGGSAPPFPVFDGYDNSKDIRFAAQISANTHWVAAKAANVLNRFCPHLRLIDLNCGCPIDMVFKSGGGSALLDNQAKLERIIRGMNATSGEIPVTAKIRMGVKTGRPTATQLIGKLAFGSRENREWLGAPGCAAVTLHGRSREQRYTRSADWGYIGECAALVKTYNEQRDSLTDTAAEPDPSTQANTKDGRMFFLGNGDCYSHVEYQAHIADAGVDSVMIGRGALVKPWLFEEIAAGQYLDKSATERLTYVEKFARYGLDAWGSDELGIGFTRRFLLEWLSFAHRYVPVGLLEHLPPSLNDRPPAYRGRNELETLMASNDYMDWIKLTEMFLGPVHPGFKFQPKHKSNAYEAEG